MAEERKGMTLPDEPKGWRRLQQLAQEESDPEKLVAIIDEINRLLDEHERKASVPNARINTGEQCTTS
jgi:hypothetical protein